MYTSLILFLMSHKQCPGLSVRSALVFQCNALTTFATLPLPLLKHKKNKLNTTYVHEYNVQNQIKCITSYNACMHASDLPNQNWSCCIMKDGNWSKPTLKKKENVPTYIYLRCPWESVTNTGHRTIRRDRSLPGLLEV